MDKTRLALVLADCPFLKCREKELLSGKLDNSESLTVLSIEDISQIVRRPLRSIRWRPHEIEEKLERALSLIHRYGIGMVTVDSPEYPPVLRELHEPPFALFWRGTLPDPEIPTVAIVGTRSPSGNGARSAERLGREFAELGFPVVSGLARGIDAFAHRGTVLSRGRAVAVLACGLERIYPGSNRVLAGKIMETGGCLVGEYLPGEEPLRFHFPQRNRLISGLSRAVIVVEAPEKSGALITADFALEQGRDLFVVRETLRSPRGIGTRNLNEQGSPAIDTARDILSVWGYSDADIPVMAASRRRGANLMFPAQHGGQGDFVFEKGSAGKDRKKL